MEDRLPIRKLLRTALFTSTGIGFITIGPVYVVAFVFGHMRSEFILKLVGLAVVSMTFIVLLFWLINILAELIFSNSPSLKNKRTLKFLSSYVFLLLLFLSIEFIALRFLNGQYGNEILQWKMKAFGLYAHEQEFLQYSKGIFPYIMITIVVIPINTIVLIILRLVLALEKGILIENENAQLKVKNIEASNQQLRQQLHPHFLFNALSTLKTLIRKQPENAEQYLLRLSDFLRASVSLDKASTVKVGEELKLCLDYLSMQKMRFGEALQFSFEVPQELNEYFVPVFSIQLLIENAIKHNSFTIESPLKIRVYSANNNIIVSNNSQLKAKREPSTGKGLANLAERYRILSGDEITVRQTAEMFSVSIKLINHADSNH